MDFLTILFLLRLLSAVCLLAFLGAIGWFLYRELQWMQRSTLFKESDYGFLRVKFPQKEPKSYPLRPVTTIGRSPANTIHLNNTYTSAQHALLTLRGEQWWLEDLKSRNGTLLNAIRLDEPTVITPNDTITIGEVELKLEL